MNAGLTMDSGSLSDATFPPIPMLIVSGFVGRSGVGAPGLVDALVSTLEDGGACSPGGRRTASPIRTSLGGMSIFVPTFRFVGFGIFALLYSASFFQSVPSL